MEVIDSERSNSDGCFVSPLEALQRVTKIRALAASSPLDRFAALRFLQTLLYWKAPEVGGIQKLRDALLTGNTPPTILDALAKEEDQFFLFDEKRPFLQDPTVKGSKDFKSVGELSSEFTVATNVAHFHHGDDENMRLCPTCLTKGVLRVVPWTQAGGAGKTPSIHGAPPIAVYPQESNFVATLGRNLVDLPAPLKKPVFSGAFAYLCDDPTTPIPLLTGLTWNPRRIFLPPPTKESTCWGCGNNSFCVEKIIYMKNDGTKKKDAKSPFHWQDPNFFYASNAPFTTLKSGKEQFALADSDLRKLVREENSPDSFVVAANPDAESWELVVPCTNAANNKTYDHRSLHLSGTLHESLKAVVTVNKNGHKKPEIKGWELPNDADLQPQKKGATTFLHAAIELLTDADWAYFSAAEYRDMHEAPAAFDIMTGLYWTLKDFVKIPRRNVIWLMLKIMASVPSKQRILATEASYNPLKDLPQTQLSGNTKGKRVYPRSFPVGPELELKLKTLLQKKSTLKNIDWVTFFQGLEELLP
jgi:hypothetical protein